MSDAQPEAARTMVGDEPLQAPLIRQFIEEHRRLASLVEAVEASLTAAEFSTAEQKLVELRAALRQHLLGETVRFYRHLETRWPANDPAALLLTEYRREMEALARHIYAFFGKYHGTDALRFGGEACRAAFARASAMLLKRMADEEAHLYPLYVPPA